MKVGRILVAIDPRHLDDPALLWAGRFALAFESEIATWPLVGHAGGAASEARQLRLEAKRRRSDLLVVSGDASGKGARERIRLAEALLIDPPCAVLVARSPSGRGPIVAATDLSAATFPAITAAADVSRRLGRPLVVAHALGRSLFAPRDLVLPSGSRSDRFTSARRWIFHALQKHGAAGARATVVDGAPERAIPELAREKEACLVVVATRSRRGMARALLGSVAGVVVRRAPCSVLVVRMTTSSRAE